MLVVLTSQDGIGGRKDVMKNRQGSIQNMKTGDIYLIFHTELTWINVFHAASIIIDSDASIQDEEGTHDGGTTEAPPHAQGAATLETLNEDDIVEFDDEFDLTDDNAWVGLYQSMPWSSNT